MYLTAIHLHPLLLTSINNLLWGDSGHLNQWLLLLLLEEGIVACGLQEGEGGCKL